MYTNNRFSSFLKKLMCSAFLTVSLLGTSQEVINTYEIADMGYLRAPMESNSGIVLSNNRYSEIYLLRNNQLTTLVKSRGCGLYTQMSKDKSLIGFKSINDQDLQAPAILDIATGKVTLLEDYCHQCGQVSFSNDGTMAYTMGNTLVIRKGDSRKTFDLGFYTNIANISPDGSQVAYSNIDGRMFIINLTTGNIELIGVQDGYNGVWSPDGSKLAIHTTIGTISVLNRVDGKIHDLGNGLSASWANNSNELIYTTIDGYDEMRILGKSVQKVNFDGTNRMTLVATSDNMPTDAILTADNRLLIPYATGEKRGLAMRMMPSTGITTMSAENATETEIFAIEDDALFGARLGDICADPNFRPATLKPTDGITTKAFEQKIGALDIEYLSQIYDSPAVNSCTKHGYVTCAPTSACMYLGYYGLLNKKATTNRYDGSTKYYAYPISSVYTNQAGTYTFNLTAYGNGCSNVPGAYGYMWNGSYSPRDRFPDFMKLNGCTSAEMQWSASSSWTKFKSESAAGRPTLLCIALESSGHLILGFATNCKYRTATGFTQQTGSFVCHDPYGDDNDTYWADNDGQHSTYDWVGYNNGQANIGTFYYSCTANPGVAVTPKLTCTPASIELSGEVGSTANTYVDVVVKGENLSTTIAVASATSAITPTKLSGWNDLTGGTLRLTLNTNFSKGAGTYDSYVAVQSTSSYRVEIKTKVTLTDPNSGNENPGTEPGTNPNPTPTTDVVTGLSEVWNISQASGKTADWITNGSQVTQDMAFANGKLYVVHRNGGNSDNTIYVVDAYTGTKTGSLPTTTCATGIYYLSSIETIGGKVIACNLQTSATGALMVYKWDSENAEPTVLLNTTNRPSDMARIGDAMSVSGDLTNGKIWFAFGSNAFYYPITNGTCSDTPTVIALTKDGAAYSFITSPAVNIYEESDGSFWIASKDQVPMHFSSTGAYIEAMNSTNVNLNGSDAKFLKLGSKTYCAATTYLNTSATTLANGAFTFFDATSDKTATSIIGKYPSAGLGTSTRNTSFRSSICTEVNSTDLNVWILIPNQGAAYYKFHHSDAVGVEDVIAEEDADAPIEYYNLQGIKVEKPENGIYIKVQGKKVSKVYVK